METKPFSMQSPEAIAKEYSGNKQKIAQAMQMGIVDPTAGTLAGMFIDRMRAAQAQEQGPPQTVAQQVFSPPQPQMPQGAPPPGAGAPPMGGMPPAPPMGGMPPMGPPPGGPPPGPPPGAGAPPMGGMPPMGPPPGAGAPPMAPPMGLAGGGLAELPIPDAMFDDGGYANGGIIAFNPGGPVEDQSYSQDNPYASMRNPNLREAISMFPGSGDNGELLDPEGNFLQRFGHHLFIGGTPEEKAAAAQKARDSLRKTGRSAVSDVVSASGVIPGSGMRSTPAVPSVERMEAKSSPAGPTFKQVGPASARTSESILDLREKGARLPNEGERYIAENGNVYTQRKPVTPAPTTMIGKTPERRAMDASVKAKAAEPAPAPAAAAKPTSELDAALAQKSLLETLAGPLDKTSTNQLNAHLKEVLSPAYQDKQKKDDMWMTLAQIGFGMAGTQSPYFLQALGQAGAAALPGMINAKKERKAEYNMARKSMADLEGASNRDKQNLAAAAVNMAQVSTKNKLDRDQLDAQILNFSNTLKFNYKQLYQQGAIAREEIGVRRQTNKIEGDKLTMWQEAQIRDKAVGRLQADPTFFVLSQRAAKDPQAAIKLQQLYRQYGVPYGSADATSSPTPGNRPPLSSFNG